MSKDKIKSIDKSKLKFVQMDDVLYDQAFSTNPIGYYKDAWLRFKKNKASLVSVIILGLLILFAAVGPLLVPYNLHSQNTKWSNRLELMPAKIKGLEWMGFNGHKRLEGYPSTFSHLPEEIIIKTSKPNAEGGVVVTVDYYKYTNYLNSYEKYTSLSVDEYNKIKEYELSTGETILIEDAPLVNGAHRVKLHFFKFLEVVYGVKDPSFWLGTDLQGRDLFTELSLGARISLLVAFSVAILNIIIGIVVGAISGYYGGLTDLIIERISEILGGLPFLAILTLLILRYGTTPPIIVLAFVMTGWLGIASLTRTQFYRYKNREFVLAARTLGAGDARIMSRHIFPSTVGTLITSLVLYIPAVIFSEATYSYLGIINYTGLGIQSVGQLLSLGQENMKLGNNHLVLFPSIFISLLMLSFNLIGNGLRDAFNPSLRGVE